MPLEMRILIDVVLLSVILISWGMITWAHIDEFFVAFTKWINKSLDEDKS